MPHRQVYRRLRRLERYSEKTVGDVEGDEAHTRKINVPLKKYKYDKNTV
jgi:hypothetical protein